MHYRALGIMVLIVPHVVSAATLHFDPQERTVGPDTPFRLAVLVDADHPVNAFDITVDLPPNVALVGTSDGGSIINYWVGAPHYDAAAHTVSFAGIVPGGFAGTNGRLLTLILEADRAGETLVGFDERASQVRQNTPDAAPEPLQFTTVALSVQAGRENLENPVPDEESPALFQPEIARDPSIADGAPLLVFATQDVGSGVAGYFVSEQSSPDEDGASWIAATSPYRLKDQTLSSWILVKAVDLAGNERIVTLGPRVQNPAVAVLHVSIVIFALMCLILMAYVRIRPRRA